MSESAKQTRASIDASVAPASYQNPIPAKCYDMVVIGAGTAGLIAALGAHALGAKVAIVEKSRMGGDCLNTGCVPSKGLLSVAKKFYQTQTLLQKLGHPFDYNPSSWIEYANRAVEKIAPHDSVTRFAKMGLDVFLGKAQFMDNHHILMEDGTQLTFRKAALCTGASPRVIHFENMNPDWVCTNETLFDLEAIPSKLLVLGSGPIGCEMAQAFSRLGSSVTVVSKDETLFSQMDSLLAKHMADTLQGEGISFMLNASIESMFVKEGVPHAIVDQKNQATSVAFDKILMAVGRQPNVDGLALEKAGVAYTSDGIVVDKRLRTTAKHIFASGDVVGGEMFTHHADAMSRVLVQNAFSPIKTRIQWNLPKVTYTDPEVASVFARNAKQSSLNKIRLSFNTIDRSIIESHEGEVVLHVDRKQRIQGCEMVHAHAGELLPQIQWAIHEGKKVSELASIVYAYPTESEIFKTLGNQARAKSFKPWMQSITRWLVTWM